MRSISQKQRTPAFIPSHTLDDCRALCAGLGSLLCLLAPQLGGGGGLDGLAGLADGGGAGNGVLAEVGAVAALGGAVDDGGVDPARGGVSPIPSLLELMGAAGGAG